tara:strand:- start:68 stop:214 length:147 start_codon:yes stop_codon:yes gene_type:complete
MVLFVLFISGAFFFWILEGFFCLCAHNIFKFEAKNDVTAHFSKKKKKE